MTRAVSRKFRFYCNRKRNGLFYVPCSISFMALHVWMYLLLCDLTFVALLHCDENSIDRDKKRQDQSGVVGLNAVTKVSNFFVS